MSDYFIIGLIGVAASLITSFLAYYFQFYKWNGSEKKNVEADTAGAMAQAAGELIEPFRVELKNLRIENQALKEKLDEVEREWHEKFSSLQTEYIQMQRELSLFKNWAERLVYQIKSYGKEPVGFLPDLQDNTNNSNNNITTNNYIVK